MNMYVYFDSVGDIQMISPILMIGTSVPADWLFALFHMSVVEDFLLAKKNTFDFYVTYTDSEYMIVRKYVPTLSQVRSLDTFLTEITYVENATIIVENNLHDNTVIISVGDELTRETTNYADATILSKFVSTPRIELYFTKHCDPHYLMHTISLVPRELVAAGTLKFTHTNDLSSASLYARRVIRDYSYIVKG